MKIVNIIGGLGNQMFQYAFALALKKHFPSEEVLIDTQHFNYIFLKRVKSCNLHNGFELDKLFRNITINVANREQIEKVSWYIPNYFLSRVGRKLLPKKNSEYIESKNYIYYPEVFEIVGSCYYEGYWQSVKFLKDCIHEIRDAFTFPYTNEYNFRIEEKMNNSNSVGIHIRRGDYLKDPEYKGLCELDYYQKALATLGVEGKEFFIFSNDIDWCKVNIVELLGGAPVTFVDGNRGSDSAWDIYLMSLCKELIIANSSFSWWGAFLNKTATKIVAPKKWINRDYEADVYLDNWIKV